MPTWPQVGSENPAISGQAFPCSSGGGNKSEVDGEKLLALAAAASDDKAAVRTSLTLDKLFGVFALSAPEDGDDKPILGKSPIACSLHQLLGLKTRSGTLTLTAQIGGVNVGGMTAIAVTSVAQDVTASSANAVPIGGQVCVLFADVVDAVDLEFTPVLTR